MVAMDSQRRALRRPRRRRQNDVGAGL